MFKANIGISNNPGKQFAKAYA